MGKPFVAAALAVLLLSVGAAQVRGETRIALVLGNAEYPGERLRNPPNDARLMAETLRQLGFEVIERTDADRTQMKQAVQELHDRLGAAGRDAVGLFYFSGHGLQLEGQNYLVPIRAQIQRESDVEIEALPVSWLTNTMADSGARLDIVVLDACRAPLPVARRFRSMNRGLARVEAASGMLIAYATSPGGVAADGEGDNSPYTAALARAMRVPGMPVELMFKRVRVEVEAMTAGAQTPWESTSLRGDFAFAGSPVLPGASAAPVAPATSPEEPQTAQSEAAPAPPLPEPSIEHAPVIQEPDTQVRPEQETLAEALPPVEPPPLPLAATQAGPVQAPVSEADAKPPTVPATVPPTAAAPMTAAPMPAEAVPIAPMTAAPMPGTSEPTGDDVVDWGRRGMTVAASAARVRAQPRLEADMMAVLPEGAAVMVTGKARESDWYRVALDDGRVGFIAARLLALVPPEGAPVPGAPVPRAARDRDCAYCPEMVPLPAGQFVMGSTAEQAKRDRIPAEFAANEQPPHSVTIARRFAIGRYEVTRAQFAAFATDTGYEAEGCAVWSGGQQKHDPKACWQEPGFAQSDRDPVTCVSWEDARAFAAWLSRKTGRTYRLPSEAEWEYAARAGSTTTRPWGDDPALACLFANAHDQTGNRINLSAWTPHPCDDGRAQTAPVGSFKANAFGLYDMMGNAAEWVGDCWRPTYGTAPANGAAWSEKGCTMRVLRGGSWASGPARVRSAYRQSEAAAERFNDVGFRVVREEE